MKKLIVPSAILAAGVAFLVGCGDENNTTEITQVVGMQVLDKGEALPKCTAENEGAMVYSVDSAEAFYCVNRKWVSMKGEKGEDGKKGADGEPGSAGADGKDGKDGKDGLKGDKGEQGVKGDSGVAGAAGLSAYEIAKAGGYAGTEEEWIASLKGDPGVKGDSGAAGAAGLSAYEIAKAGGYAGTEEQWIESLKGDSGDPGINCEIVKDSGGVVKMECGTQATTIYKAVCGKDPYDLNEKFCYGVDLYDYCDGKVYNPDKQFCAKFDDESEQVYKMTTIKGVNYTKTWMAENLNYETAAGSYCCDGWESNCQKYGRLYTWATAVGKSEDDCGYGNSCSLGSGKVRGLCPEGWHLPDTTEWKALFDAVGGKAKAGKMLKSTEGWHVKTDLTSGNGSDSYSFSALPAGNRYDDGDFGYEGYQALFWSSTERNSESAYFYFLNNSDDVSQSFNHKAYGFYVRCLRD